MTPSSSGSLSTFGRGDGRVRGVPPGGESVGRRIRNHVHLRHRQARALRQPRGDLVQRVLRTDCLRAIHAEDDLVREPVRSEVHDEGKEERHHQAVRPPDELPDHEHQAAQRAEEQCCLKSIRHVCILPVDPLYQRREERRAPGKVCNDDMLVQRVSAIPFRAEAI